MELIPVLDLMNGQVVRGIAGNRSSYVGNQSVLTPTSSPRDTAAALRQQFGSELCYVADLDAISGRPLQIRVLQEIIQVGAAVCVDAGIRSIDDVANLLRLGVDRVVIGLETLPSLEFLALLVEQFGAQRLVFSLDLKRGIPITRFDSPRCAFEVAEYATRVGFDTLIVLDLDSVGTGSGVPTLPLCRALKERFSPLTIWTGGGARGLHDLDVLCESQIDGVLIASALHDGQITPEGWRQFQSRPTSPRG